MMVGHAAVGFAVAAAGAWMLDVERRRAIAVGLVAAAFATAPDVDMAYALVGAVSGGVGGVWDLVNGFWAGSQVSHRGGTHSLVIGVGAVAVAGGVVASRVTRWAAVVLAVAVAAGVTALSGAVAGVTVALFMVAVASVAVVASSGVGLGSRAVAATAAVGVLSHPWGDVFTGEPPAFLYPLGASLLDARVALVPEPTLNLVAVFLLELVTVWVAIAVGFRLEGERLAPHVGTRAAAGAFFVAAFFLLQPPTLQRSYHFVFSAVGIAVVGALAPGLLRDRSARDVVAAAVTGVAAVTLAVGVYGGAYAVDLLFL